MCTRAPATIGSAPPNNMTLQHAMAVGVMILATIVTSATAFVTPATNVAGFRGSATLRPRTSSSARSTERGLSMSCRANAKKEKRQRNRDNMRKFNRKGTSRKRLMRVQRNERAAEAEAQFMAEVFHSGMDDWEDVDIMAEDD